jgi:hypothetical protein
MAQSGMGQQHMNKCGHAGCSCTVEPGQTYCSDHCAKQASANTSAELPGGKPQHGAGCQCGHPGCQHK